MLEDMSDGFYSIPVREFQILKLINFKFEYGELESGGLRAPPTLSSPPAARGGRRPKAPPTLIWNLESGIWKLSAPDSASIPRLALKAQLTESPNGNERSE